MLKVDNVDKSDLTNDFTDRKKKTRFISEKSESVSPLLKDTSPLCLFRISNILFLVVALIQTDECGTEAERRVSSPIYS